MDGLRSRRPHPGLNLTDDSREISTSTESDIFGFWIFLMSDAVVFALLFAIYGTMTGSTAGGPGPKDIVKLGPAFLETLILLTSSLTFGMASIALKHDAARRWLLIWLVLTLGLGAAFMTLEVRDFMELARSNAGPERSGYLSALHVLVGMHGAHVSAGIVWLIVMLMQIVLRKIDHPTRVNLVRLSLFWHFLDIVWIAIFSIVYLQAALPGELMQ